MSATPATTKPPMSPIRTAIYAGIVVAMIAVFLAQKLSEDVQGSQDKTLMFVAGGFVLGAIGGFFAARARKQAQS